MYLIYALLCKGLYLERKPSSRCGSPKCVITPVLYYNKKSLLSLQTILVSILLLRYISVGMVIKYHIYTSKITPRHARFEFDGSPRESREQFHCPNIFLIRVNEILLMKNCHENKNIKEY